MTRLCVLMVLLSLLFAPAAQAESTYSFNHRVLEGTEGYSYDQSGDVWVYSDAVRVAHGEQSLDVMYAAIPVGDAVIANYLVFACPAHEANEALKEVVIWADRLRIALPLNQQGISVMGKEQSLISGGVLLTPKDTALLGLLRNAAEVRIRVSTTVDDYVVYPDAQRWAELAGILDVVLQHGILQKSGDSLNAMQNGITIE